MQVSGKIHEIFETNIISDSFRKREFIAECSENENYPQFIKFETVQDNCEILNEYETGDEVEIHFNLRGKPWTNKKGEKVYFNSLQVWKLEKITDSDSPQLDKDSDLPDNDLPF